MDRPSDSLQLRLEAILGERPVSISPLSGGCIASVTRATLQHRLPVVVKRGPSINARLDIEAQMLSDLAATETLQTPKVIHAEPDLLLLEFIENNGARSIGGGERFAESLARLHAMPAEQFGYGYDTVIGPLPQPNGFSASWPAFYADQRIRPMARLAVDRGGLCPADADRLDRLCDRMDVLIGEPPSRPALIHGDLWSGNVLWNNGEIAGVIDPAIYHADPEVELAFIDLMGGFDRSFFERYDAIAGIRPGFWETRRDLYTLYPLLVHAALFQGGYGTSVMATAARLGF